MKRYFLIAAIALGICASGAWGATANLTHAVKMLPTGRHATPSFAHLSRHPRVALTFDDLPAAGGLLPGETRTAIITRLARELRARHLKGTYGFVNAADLKDDPDTQKALRSWVSSGMNIGNHTWSHPSFSSLDAAADEQEIALDESALRLYAGKRNWHWFRYPYLEEGDTINKREQLRAWLRAHGYHIAEVTLTTQDDDWSDPYERCVAKHDTAGIAWLRQSYLAYAAAAVQMGREEEKIAFGREIPNVMVLHATDFTLTMLPSLLQMLHQEGFRFRSLDRVEHNRAYSLDPRAGLADGGTFPNLFLDAHHLQYPPITQEPLQQLNSMCR